MRVLVCVTCTAEGEGLTVGDKPDRPARCDYHPPDPLSLFHTHTLTHGHAHTHAYTMANERVCCEDLVLTDRRTNREALDHRQDGNHKRSK